MCGIFFARSLGSKINEDKLEHAFKYIKERGPDKTYTFKSTEYNFILVNSVLNITQEEGDIRHPFDEDILLSYNGEIYGWSQYGEFKNDYSDTKTFDKIINKKVDDIYLNDKNGFFAFLKLLKKEGRFTDLLFGTDLTAEKNLYYYFDSKNIIISSSPKSIYKFLIINDICEPEIDILSCQSYLFSRNLIYNPGSFIKNIKLLPYGNTFKYDFDKHKIDNISQKSIFDKYKVIYKNFCNQYDDEVHIKEGLNISTSLNKNKIISSTFSGGIDSSVVSYFMIKNNQNKIRNLVTLNFENKDKVSLKSNYLYELIKEINTSHLVVDVDLDMYENESEYCYERLLSPLPTHSYPSFSLICRILSKNGCKILFVGDGADELFGGYSAYDSIKDGNSDTSISPYSYFFCENNSIFKEIHKNIKDNLDQISNIKKIKSYLNCDENKATLIASRFLDYELNLRSTGLLCSDLIGSSHGIECRSPLVTKKIVANFLFGSIEKDIKDIKSKKKDLKNIFRKIYGDKYIFPKQGFSGFPNEYALRQFGEKSEPVYLQDLFKCKIGSFNQITNHREQWKVLNLEKFLISL